MTPSVEAETGSTEEDPAHDRVRARMRQKLDEGFFDDREIEIMVREKPTMPMKIVTTAMMERDGREKRQKKRNV